MLIVDLRCVINHSLEITMSRFALFASQFLVSFAATVLVYNISLAVFSALIANILAFIAFAATAIAADALITEDRVAAVQERATSFFAGVRARLAK